MSHHRRPHGFRSGGGGPPKVAAEEMRHQLPFGVVDRYLTDLGWRHHGLKLSEDLFSMKCLWVGKSLDLPLYEPVSVDVNADNVTQEINTPPSPDSAHYVSVMILLGATENNKLGQQHLSRRLKFLAYTDAKGQRFIGADWEESDGKKPTEAAFKKTAIRAAKRFGVDLSGCKKWLKFSEIVYQRADGKKCTSHVYIPVGVSDLEPKTAVEEVTVTVTEFREKEVTEEDKDGKQGEEEKKNVVKEGVKVDKLVNRPKQRPVQCSLHDLISCINDETALLARGFDEMLTCKYGGEVLDLIREETSKKRKREEEEEEENAKKKQKLEEGKKETEGEKKEEEKKEEEKKEEEKKEEKEEDTSKPKMKWVVTYKEEVLRPCQYMDRPASGIATGIVRRDAIEGLLARQDEPMCLREMKNFGERNGFSYVNLATVRTQREVTPEPEPKEVEEDKKEEKEETEAKEMEEDKEAEKEDKEKA